MTNNSKLSAMILAAGRGRRMKDLTNNCPKPLIKVAGKALIEHQIERLVQAGIEEVIINVAYLGKQIVDQIGFGERWGIRICYLYEDLDAYDTGGGVKRALAWLSDPFLVVNADVWTDYPFIDLVSKSTSLAGGLAHIVLAPNPKHNLTGDYGVNDVGLLIQKSQNNSFTYTGISLYQKALFNSVEVGQCISLPKIWQQAMLDKRISGEVYHENWCDVGTPERWKEINQ